MLHAEIVKFGLILTCLKLLFFGEGGQTGGIFGGNTPCGATTAAGQGFLVPQL